jgi:hypothetical protein
LTGFLIGSEFSGDEETLGDEVLGAEGRPRLGVGVAEELGEGDETEGIGNSGVVVAELPRADVGEAAWACVSTERELAQLGCDERLW